MKNTSQETFCANNPLVEENISRDKLITDDKSAYCVAVYNLLHKEDIYATKAVVAKPEEKFSRVIMVINNGIL